MPSSSPSRNQCRHGRLMLRALRSACRLNTAALNPYFSHADPRLRSIRAAIRTQVNSGEPAHHGWPEGISGQRTNGPRSVAFSSVPADILSAGVRQCQGTTWGKVANRTSRAVWLGSVRVIRRLHQRGIVRTRARASVATRLFTDTPTQQGLTGFTPAATEVAPT